MAASSASAAGSAGTTDPIAAAHAKLLQDPTLQFDFNAIPPPQQLPEWLRAIFRFLASLRPLFEILFWVGVAVLAALILYFIGRELLRYYTRPAGGRPTIADNSPDWRPPVARAKALLADADQLAAQGLFAEAVHLLLFRSIDDIDTRRPRTLTPALTSRDILALNEIPIAPRQAFARIAAMVERSFFGGRSVDANDFAECRRAYEAFAFPDAWNERLA